MDEKLADESLMRDLQQGQFSAGGLLYHRYKKMLLAFFMNCTGERAQSEDLVQMTFEKMIRYRSNFGGTGSFKSWLFAIARNVLSDQYRKGQRWRAVHEKQAAPIMEAKIERQLMESDRLKLLEKALAQLPPEKREMLAMVKLEGMKYREVAKIYNMNESTLKVNIFRTMHELKKIVADIEWSAY